jgi:hypothetical protein
MSYYDDMADALARVRGSAGSKEQRFASAHLLYAMLHYECVELCRALKKQDFEVSLFESVSDFSLRMNGTRVTIGRFSGQSELRAEFYGFDSRLIEPAQTTIRQEISALSREELAVAVASVVAKIDALWRAEFALRYGAP